MGCISPERERNLKKQAANKEQQNKNQPPINEPKQVAKNNNPYLPGENSNLNPNKKDSLIKAKDDPFPRAESSRIDIAISERKSQAINSKNSIKADDKKIVMEKNGSFIRATKVDVASSDIKQQDGKLFKKITIQSKVPDTQLIKNSNYMDESNNVELAANARPYDEVDFKMDKPKAVAMPIMKGYLYDVNLTQIQE